MGAVSFGKYDVLARITTGGAASIFLARQKGAAGFNKLVCLKTLLPERIIDQDFVAMFLDEARLAARLNHPNCVQIYDLGRVRGVYYISMEYILGDTLWNLLTTVTKFRAPLPQSQVASILASACDGLHHAHELKDGDGRPYNLVHRDVSPQNIMLAYQGQTKVVDFGIAKAETGRDPTSAGVVKGKFSYMSPEQITGGQVDRRSDIYSLGIVLFECLASRRLYRGESPEEIAHLILEHRAPRLRDVVADIPKELDAICARALARHPSKRFQSAVEMGDALREYLDHARLAHTTTSIAALLSERFGARVTDQQRIFEQATIGTHLEAELLDVFDGRQVRRVDLFPEDLQEPSEDFSEATQASGLTDPLAAGEPLSADALEPPESTSKREGAGWRVELKATGNDADSFSMPRSENDEVALGPDAPTDLLPKDVPPEIAETEEDAAATRVDPASIVEQDHRPSDPSEVHDVVPPQIRKRSSFRGGGTLESVDATLVDDFGDVTDEQLDKLRSAGNVAVAPVVDPAEASISLGSETEMPNEPVHAVRPPSRAQPSAVLVRPAQVRTASVPTRRNSSEAVGDDGPTSILQASSPSMLPAPVSGYSATALVAAFGFGVSVGLVAGLLLAKVVFM